MSAQTNITTYTSGQFYDLAKAMLNINELDNRTKSTKLDFNNIQKLGDKLEPIEQEFYQGLVNNVSLTLSWGDDRGGFDNAFRNETYPTGAASANQAMKVHLLIANISHWSKISALSPVLRVERFRRQKNRGNSSTKRRTGGFKFMENSWSQRPSQIPIPSASWLLDLKPEKYFKTGTGFPAISGDSSNTNSIPSRATKPKKQLIQFRLEITVNGVKIVSNPLIQLKITAKRDDDKNRISYSYY